MFSDDAAPDTIQQNTIEWDWYRTIFNDEDFEEKIIEELADCWECDVLPKFVHIYKMILPDGDEEPLYLKTPKFLYIPTYRRRNRKVGKLV